MGEKGKKAGMFDHPWEQHWESLRLYLTRHSQGMYRTYQELIRLLFEFVINREEELCGRKEFQTDCMKVIGDGDERGKLIFFVPRDRTFCDYIYTYIEYCADSDRISDDALKRIQKMSGGTSWEEKVPDEKQVEEYRKIFSLLLKRCQPLEGLCSSWEKEGRQKMDQELAKAWENYSWELKAYLKSHPQGDYGSYDKLVRLTFDYIINRRVKIHNGEIQKKPAEEYEKFQTERMTVLGGDDYKGIMFYILATERAAYQEELSGFCSTFVEYGSCYGCDMLKAIQGYDDWKALLPDKQQLEDYMMICLELLQHFRFLKEAPEPVR